MSAETLDTDLIPKVIGRAQSRAVSYDEEGEAIRARQQFGALLDRVRRLEEALREVHTTPREAMSLDAQMDLDRRVQRLLGLGGA